MHVGEVAAEFALHGHIVGGPAARLLEFPVLGLLLGIEDRPGGLFGQRLEVVVVEHRITLAGDMGMGVLGPGVKDFQAGFRVDTNRGSRHGLNFSLHWNVIDSERSMPFGYSSRMRASHFGIWPSKPKTGGR